MLFRHKSLVTGDASNIKTNQSINQSTNQSVDKYVSNNVSKSINVNGTKGVYIAERKFRVVPTVLLRPVNDVITKNEDGLIELYIDNPSLNDVTMNVDARISVPSAGVKIYGQGFGQAGAAGAVYGTFSVPPGSVRTIYINIKGEKVGNFTVHFDAFYWLEDNKDNYTQLSLNQSFMVQEPSENYDQTLILVLIAIISIVLMAIILIVLKDAN